MKTFLKNYRILAFFLSLFLVLGSSLMVVHAQSEGISFSGDEICGGYANGTITKRCDLEIGASIIKNILYKLVLPLSLTFIVVIVAIKIILAYKAAVSGDAGVYKRLREQAGNAMLGFLIIVIVVAGGFMFLLKSAGVKDQFLIILKLFSQTFVIHAYAAEGAQLLPNPIGSNNLYDLLLTIARLIIKFFVYPGLIAMWVWTGFAFVFAQGKPEALSKAKKFFVWAFVSTLIVMLLQTFLMAVQGTVQKILPTQKSQSAQVPPTTPPAIINNNGNNNGTPDTRTPPKDGTYGASCTTDTGAYGTIGTDGKCQAGRSASYDIACNVRNGGTCRKDGKDGSCYDYLCVLPWTDPCTALNQVHASCTSQDGRAGTCLLNINTNKFMCQPK